MTSTGYAFILIVSLLGFVVEVAIFYFIIKWFNNRSKRKQQEKINKRIEQLQKQMEKENSPKK